MWLRRRLVEGHDGKNYVLEAGLKQYLRAIYRVSTVTLFMVASGTVLAQSAQIPQDLLDLDHQRCMKDCTPGFGEVTCKPLCSCTVTEFKKRLDFSKYLDLSAQLSKDELSPQNRALLDNIANFCAAELDKAGIPIGGPTATEAKTSQD